MSKKHTVQFSQPDCVGLLCFSLVLFFLFFAGVCARFAIGMPDTPCFRFFFCFVSYAGRWGQVGRVALLRNLLHLVGGRGVGRLGVCKIVTIIEVGGQGGRTGGGCERDREREYIPKF